MAGASFDDDHEAFRESVRAFLAAEVLGTARETDEPPDDALIAAAAEQGLLGVAIGEEHGGGGVDDPRFEAVALQECARAGLTGLGLLLAGHAEAARLLVRHGPDPDTARWLSRMATGELLGALAVGGGLVPDEDGATVTGVLDDVVGGAAAGLLVAEVPGSPAPVVLDTTGPGVRVAPVTDRLGGLGAATADVTVHSAAAVRLAGGATTTALLVATVHRLLALAGAAGGRAALETTLTYVAARHVFGAPVAAFENTRHVLVEVATALDAADVLVNDVLVHDVPGAAPVLPAAAGAALRATDAFVAAADQGLQLHGGYGYMREYPISRAFADSRYLRLRVDAADAVGAVATALGLPAAVVPRSRPPVSAEA